MIWHEATRLAFQIGTPLAAVRVLTWLVALFGRDRLSNRAMMLLRRRPPDHGDSVLGTEQAGVLPVLIFTPAARKRLIPEVTCGEFDNSGPPSPETKDDPKAFRNGRPTATKATDLILEPIREAQRTVVKRPPVDRDIEAA
jgi:hypothetical protein